MDDNIIWWKSGSTNRECILLNKSVVLWLRYAMRQSAFVPLPSAFLTLNTLQDDGLPNGAFCTEQYVQNATRIMEAFHKILLFLETKRQVRMSQSRQTNQIHAHTDTHGAYMQSVVSHERGQREQTPVIFIAWPCTVSAAPFGRRCRRRRTMPLDY